MSTESLEEKCRKCNAYKFHGERLLNCLVQGGSFSFNAPDSISMMESSDCILSNSDCMLCGPHLEEYQTKHGANNKCS